jgi:hypothetical protein
MWWYLTPVFVLGAVVVLFGLLVLLGRYKQGALLRPVIARLSRIRFMRRLFQKVSTAAIERQNPELASALRKMSPAASNPNPQAVQKAMSRLTAAERRAYMEAVQEQGDSGIESIGRQERRRLERQTRGPRPGGSGGGTASRKRKRR